MSYRVFLFRENTHIVRIPNPKFHAAYCSKVPLEDFAGEQVRWLQVYVELKDRKPFRISGYRGSYLWFDRHGFIEDRERGQLLRLRMHLTFSKGRYDNATLEKKLEELEQLRAEREWQPTSEEEAAIERLLWPNC